MRDIVWYSEKNTIDTYNNSRLMRKESLLLDTWERGNWRLFVNLATSDPSPTPELLKFVFSFYDEIPDPDLKYELAVLSYMHYGDRLPEVRKAIRALRNYKNRYLPEWLQTQEKIKVYRAGDEPIEKARCRISWTSSREVAEWVLYVWKPCTKKYLYQGEIETKNIIAYTDALKEEEIMQYRSVKNIISLPVDDELFRYDLHQDETMRRGSEKKRGCDE